MPDLDLLQGTLDTLVLKTLSWGPRRGYSVARWIKETSEGTIKVEDRAVYVALDRLEERRLVESTLRQKSADWTAYANAVFKILKTG